MKNKKYIKNLKTYQPIYLNKIYLNENITFSLEIEYKNAFFKDVSNFVKKTNEKEKTFLKNDYEHVTRNFLIGEQIGGELTMGPLQDKFKDWKLLKDIMTNLKKLNAKIDFDCGGHVIVGMQSFKQTQSLINFFKLWAIFEDVIYQFTNGEYREYRGDVGGKDYAKKIAYYIYKNVDLIKQDDNVKGFFCELFNISFFNSLKRCHNKSIYKAFALSENPSLKYAFNNVIEFRCPNATLNEIVSQNNINFFCKLISLSNDIDQHTLESLYKKEKRFGIDDDKKIFLLADLMYQNEIEKNNFLYQCYYKQKTLAKRF